MEDGLECGYSDRGCLQQFLHLAIRRRHEAFCDFRPYPCPLRDVLYCDWEGEPSHLSSHVQSQHSSVSSLPPFPLEDGQTFFLRTAFSGFGAEEEAVGDDNPAGNPTVVSLAPSFDETFYLCLSPPPLPSFLRVVGSRKRARSLVYKLELRKKLRRVVWEAKPVCIFDRVAGFGKKTEAGKDFLTGTDNKNDSVVDDIGDNMIWLESKTLTSFAEENGMIHVKVILELESNLQRSGWSKYENCVKCTQLNAIDTDYVFLSLNQSTGDR